MSELFHGGRVALHGGDCLDRLKEMADASVDSVVTDPPYHLTSIVKRFGGDKAAACRDYEGGTGAYKRASRGFMGKQWDGGDIAFRVELWAEVLRVLKPGGHLVAFSGTRTYHRMACAIEDAGFEIRDQIAWLYGTGFPKSHDFGEKFSKALYGPYVDEDGGERCEASHFEAHWTGWGTALKPAIEPICLARKPLSEGSVAANVLRHGTGAIHVEACKIASSAEDQKAMARVVGFNVSYSNGESGVSLAGSADGSLHRRDRSEFDPTKGRWPANVVHDGSGEVVAAFPDAPGQRAIVGPQHGAKARVNVYGDYGPRETFEPRRDSGSAARFFYSAKADGDDRLASKHPTVKPVDLMRWLVRLVTPPGGVVLDPFAGTGTTGEAALLEGFRAVLIEREAEYRDDIARRVRLVFAHGREKREARAATRKAAAAPLLDGLKPEAAE